MQKVVESDVLVLGGGMAGCSAAITAREMGLKVTLVDKAYVGKSGTSAAAGMRFSVFSEEHGDNYEETYKALTGLATVDRNWTEICIKESYQAFKTLSAWGVQFPVENEKEGVFVPKNKADSPFTSARIIRREVPVPLRKKAEAVGVNIMDRITVTDLLRNKGRVIGAVGFPLTDLNPIIFRAKAVVLATGSWSLRTVGAETHNMTGDGQAMAYRIGADLTGGDMHSSHHGSAAYPSWRGGRAARAIARNFVDSEGNVIDYGFEVGPPVDVAFHEGRWPIYHDLDRASDDEIERTWQRQLHSDAMESERIGFDPRKRGKHLISGGQDCTVGAALWPTGLNCETTIPGLYAAGDTLSIRAPGFGGLPTAHIMGVRAAQGAARYAAEVGMLAVDKADQEKSLSNMLLPVQRKGGFSPRWVTQLLLNTMVPYYVLLIQRGDRLQAALTNVEFFRDHFVPKLLAGDPHELRLAHETKNMILGAELALKVCLFRTETRGSHFREDYPKQDDANWLVWIKEKQDQDGQMKIWKEPIPKEWLPSKSKAKNKKVEGDII